MTESQTIYYYPYCSFCQSDDHDVSECDSNALYQFKQTCAINRIIFGYRDTTPATFKDWLTGEIVVCSHLVTAFSARYCDVPISTNVVDRLEKITQVIYGLNPMDMILLTNPSNNPIISLALSDVEEWKYMGMRKRLLCANNIYNSNKL